MVTFEQARAAVEAAAPGTITAPYGYGNDRYWFPALLPERAGGRIPAVDKHTAAVKWISAYSPEYSQDETVGQPKR